MLKEHSRRTVELPYDLITAELVLARQQALERVLRGVSRKYPQIRPMVKAAQKFAQITDQSLEGENLPPAAQRIKDQYFGGIRAIEDLFEELVDTAQELKKYQT